MFDRLIHAALQHRLLVLLIAAATLVWGAWAVARMPVDVFPDLNRPTVTVMSEAGSLSPEEVEALVTRPLELALRGAPGAERVRSQSGPGLSVVWVEFGWAVDPWRARQHVEERLIASEDALPSGVRPHMAPQSSIMGEILLVGLVATEGDDGAPTVPGTTLRTLADWTVRPRLLSIPGISQVTALGGGVEEVQIRVDPVRLAARGVTLEAVVEAAGASQGNTAGGFLDRKDREHLVRVLARTTDVDAIGRTPVAVGVLLRDVATVERGPAPKRGDAGVDGRPAVVLSVQKQPGASTLALTAAVDTALAELGAALPAGVTVVPLFRQADFIDAAVLNVEHALRDGVILVAIVLVLFLLEWRTTVITLTAIPLSFMVAALVLAAFGLSVNTMTLGGLAVAIGELVDDAIVDVENVWRRLREARAEGRTTPLEIIRAASGEVRNSIVYSTVLVVLVFVPLFALDGVEGRLFAPLGVAYVTAIVASMLVSLTLTPVLCSYLLPKAALRAGERGDGALVRALKRLDRAVLARVLPHPGKLLVAVGVLAAITVVSVPFLGTSFLPPFNEGTATINLQAAPGTSLAESDRLGRLAELQLLDVPEVARVGRRTGRAEGDEHAEGVHYTEIDVDFHATGDDAGPDRPSRPRADVLADVRARLALLPGLSVNLGQPISHRLDHLLSGVRAAIAVKLYGPDLHVLRAEAARVAAAIEGIPGLVDLQVERQVLVPEVEIAVDRDAAERFGVPPGAVADTLQTALAGATVGQIVDGARTTDLVVRYGSSGAVPDGGTGDLGALRATPFVLPDGRVVSVGQLADVRTGTGPNEVLHEDGQRRIVVSANTAGRDVGGVVADIEAALAELGELPEGVYTHIAGQFESQRAAATRIGWLSLASLVGMYAVLWSHFRSHAIVLQVLLNLPLALIGAVAAIWLSGQPLSVATLVGMVTLAGIASRNTILMISHYFHLAHREGMAFGPALVVRGSLERLVPVTMTALTAGVGLLPLAFGGGAPGKEILTPVAQVILGGLVSSTLLDMIVTPAVFLRFGGAAIASARPPTGSL